MTGGQSQIFADKVSEYAVVKKSIITYFRGDDPRDNVRLHQ